MDTYLQTYLTKIIFTTNVKIKFHKKVSILIITFISRKKMIVNDTNAKVAEHYHIFIFFAFAESAYKYTSNIGKRLWKLKIRVLL